MLFNKIYKSSKLQAIKCIHKYYIIIVEFRMVT